MKRTAQRTRLVLVSALAVVALALAGCATDNDDNGGDTGSTTTVPLLTTTTVP
jgi:predicted outer membrane protein